MPVHECNSHYCRSTYPYEKLNPMITERLLYTDKKATNSFVNNLCLLRKTRTCRNQQEMSWGLNEICILMQWLLEGGDLLQEQPVGFEVQTPVEKPFLEVIKCAFPFIKAILDEICDAAKQQMKDISSDVLGSWSRAVTTCDGCWQIRGYFSQNCTFIIKNYLTGGLLYYGHLSMRGADKICDEEFWQGTAKAAEGHLAQVLWSKAKDEDLKVEVNLQDADSSSALGFRYSFPHELESKVMLCGGHVGRANGKKLQELQSKSTVTTQFIALHKEQFPNIQSANNDPEKYRVTMLTLGKYHSRDIHSWEECSFHPLVKCSCKKCDVDLNGFCPEMKWSGEAYHSAHVLKCDFHGLLYEIECANRAKDAEKVIDPNLVPTKTKRIKTKIDRTEDQKLRKKYTAKCQIQHSYVGDDDDDIDEELAKAMTECY
ncbi:Hypothetical predicted protein [Paramuricea clavata]|uniref:Uncharacterized protein n=1 Tax=Paramuricea clavata TaxID=317549 RepID=A0A6S7HH09_PARCT|nr:Hypothetical predicted protein [Paramuricea clavata]